MPRESGKSQMHGREVNDPPLREAIQDVLQYSESFMMPIVDHDDVSDVVRERVRAQATPALRGRDMRRAARLATFAICISHQQALHVGPNDAGAFRQPN